MQCSTCKGEGIIVTWIVGVVDSDICPKCHGTGKQLTKTEKKVYILSDYGEYGSENVRATLDKTKLVGMLGKLAGGGYQNDPDTFKGLAELIDGDKISEDGVGTDLQRGSWGGAMLHIIELE